MKSGYTLRHDNGRSHTHACTYTLAHTVCAVRNTGFHLHIQIIIIITGNLAHKSVVAKLRLKAPSSHWGGGVINVDLKVIQSS